MKPILDTDAFVAIYEAVTHALNLQRRFAPDYLGSPDLCQGTEAMIRLGHTVGLIDDGADGPTVKLRN